MSNEMKLTQVNQTSTHLRESFNLIEAVEVCFGSGAEDSFWLRRNAFPERVLSAKERKERRAQIRADLEKLFTL